MASHPAYLIKGTTKMTKMFNDSSATANVQNTSYQRQRGGSLPAINTIVEGVVAAVLKEKGGNAVPYAVLVTFKNNESGEHVDMLRGKDMNGNDAERRERLSNIKRGDKVEAMVVGSSCHSDGKPRIDLSESARESLTQLNELVDTETVGKVVSTTAFGAFVEIGAFTGLVHISELATASRRDLEILLKGTEMRVIVTNVEPDPVHVGKFRIALSESAYYLRQAAKLAETDTVLTGTVLGTTADGIRISLKNGVEGFLPFGRMGTTDEHSLKKGMRTQVKVVGVQGLALLVTREGFNSAREHAKRESSLAERRARDQALRSKMQGRSGGADMSKGKKK
jgi:hypothetical protein